MCQSCCLDSFTPFCLSPWVFKTFGAHVWYYGEMWSSSLIKLSWNNLSIWGECKTKRNIKVGGGTCTVLPVHPFMVTA